MTNSVLAVSDQMEAVPTSLNKERGGLNIQFGQPSAQIAKSDVWSMAGRTIEFVRLPANASVGLDQAAGRIFVKVITGSLATPARESFCSPKALLNTEVTEAELAAGNEGALLAVVAETKDAPQPISAMSQLAFNGPLAEALQWRTFEEHFKQFTDYFDGMDAYIGPGFHILNADGVEITYVNIWTAGKGVDLSTHDHGQDPSALMPAFAEIHWTLSNGTGQGGMYECAEPGASEKQRLPVQTGEEHGPFFFFDGETGRPRMRENGAVDYPWHGWEAGNDGAAGQAYDVVAAFETNPDMVRVQN